MTNLEYLKILIAYWEESISFDLLKDNKQIKIGLFRGDSKRPHYIGKSIDDVILQVRLSIGDILIKEALKELNPQTP